VRRGKLMMFGLLWAGLVLLTVGCGKDASKTKQAAYQEAVRANRVNQYASFLATYPQSEEAEDIKDRVNQLITEQARALEAKFLWKEATAKWAEAVKLTGSLEAEMNQTICESKGPVEIVYEQITSRDTDVVDNITWPGWLNDKYCPTYPVFGSTLHRYKVTLRSISPQPIKSITISLRESSESPKFHTVELLKKPLLPGEYRVVAFEVKTAIDKSLSREKYRVDGEEIEEWRVEQPDFPKEPAPSQGGPASWQDRLTHL